MPGDPSRSTLRAAAIALHTHDILYHVFEYDKRPGINNESLRLSDGDLLRCALVSRAFCQPALAALWADMSRPMPLWLLLVLMFMESLPEKSPSNSFDAVYSHITSERTYTDPHRWARFKWYARFVRKLNAMEVHADHQNKWLIQTLVAHNGGESIFPSLRCLWWPVFPFSDTSFFPLLASRIRSVVFDFHRSDFCGKELEGDIYLAELRASSPRLCQLSIWACKQRVGMNHSRIIASFEHITELSLFAHISLASFLKVAAMPFLESLRIDYVHSEEPEPVHPRHRVYAPCLKVLSISANCSSLTQIATALDAPNLATAMVQESSESTCRDQCVDYMSLVAALATLGSPSTMEDLHVALWEGSDPPVLEHLANLIAPFLVFTNLTRFCLLCPSVLLVGDHNDFLAAARAWLKLRVFQLVNASWATRVDPDDENSEPIPTLTPQVLECFRDHFPVLEELMLPYLDFYADVPARRVLRGGSCHGLARLAVGPKSD